MLKVKVILGSTRQNRFGDKPAKWIVDELKKRDGLDVELLDLRDWPLPFLDDPMPPSMVKDGNYPDPMVKKWAEKIKEADAFIIASPEYIHGYPAVLKNALDHVYLEWNRKVVSFVSWGSVGGARVVEQLRQVAVELQMASTRKAVHIQWPLYMAITQAKEVQPELFAPVQADADAMIDQIIWWGTALQSARK